MPFDGGCVICGEPAAYLVRHGDQIEEGICASCVKDPRHNPRDHATEVLPVQPLPAPPEDTQ